MVENCVRLIIVALIFLVVMYYAYLLVQVRVFFHNNLTVHNEERMTLLRQKLVPTVLYVLCMIITGLLYLVGINMIILSGILMLLNVIVAFVGDKKILSKTDINNL